MAQEVTYDKIDRPYNASLQRSAFSDSTNFAAGTSEMDGSPSIKSGSALTDMWLETWIKSRSYQPKTQGFMIDAREGYIECMKLYVGTGGMIGGALNIPDETSIPSFHVNATGDTWWGSPALNTAVASVLNTGEATFTNITITGLQAGSQLDGQFLMPGSVLSASASLALVGWTFTSIFTATDLFTATDYRTVSWTAGTFTTSGGTAYTISAGNTAGMTTLTYIYLDINASSTVLQHTTTAATAVGDGKVLIATAGPNTDSTSKAKFQVFGGSGGERIFVDSISANSASTNEFITNSAQIGNAIINSASIKNLQADKIVAGSGIVNDLQVYSKLTMGVNGSTGIIESSGWNDIVNGFQIKGGSSPSIKIIGGTLVGGTIKTDDTAQPAVTLNSAGATFFGGTILLNSDNGHTAGYMGAVHSGPGTFDIDMVFSASRRYIKFEAPNAFIIGYTGGTQELRADTDSTASLGTSSYRWRDIYATTHYVTNGGASYSFLEYSSVVSGMSCSTNFLVNGSMISTGQVYVNANRTDTPNDNAWRLAASGTNLIIQRYRSGAWVTCQTITGI